MKEPKLGSDKIPSMRVSVLESPVEIILVPDALVVHLAGTEIQWYLLERKLSNRGAEQPHK